MTSVIKPPRLNVGDTIGIAAPASAFDEDAFTKGIRRIQEAGYRPLFQPDIFSRSNYLAGSDKRRADELNRLFADRSINAIFCARGGYGSQRILPMLDGDTIRKNPKIFMGYSDVTALHCYLYNACGLVTFHGPLVTEFGDMSEDALRVVFDALGNPAPWGELPSSRLDVLRPGESEGILLGGSLSVFACTLGTPYDHSTADAILFFEDRGEKPYAIDRLFSHLKSAGKLDGVRAYTRSIHPSRKMVGRRKGLWGRGETNRPRCGRFEPLPRALEFSRRAFHEKHLLPPRRAREDRRREGGGDDHGAMPDGLKKINHGWTRPEGAPLGEN
ncbi:MAG: LD-carboxypeptidase [bacterium]